MGDRKDDHIKLALKSQTRDQQIRNELSYEPLFHSHQSALKAKHYLERDFLGKKLRAPLWISSMTGGGSLSGDLNRKFAEVANKYGLGMGLGSCRPVIENPASFDDFNVRHIIGKELPLLSNIGHAQAEELVLNGELDRLNEMTEKLSCDALILHINPLQEWFQPEGDRFVMPAIELIEKLLDKVQTPLVVKEVGQGIGPRSLEALIKLAVAGIEFGAFGGTNFSFLEALRQEEKAKDMDLDPMIFVGHTAEMMVDYINDILNRLENQNIPMMIISGGIKDYLQGHNLMTKLNCPAMYAQAGMLLKMARESKEQLDLYVNKQVQGLLMANAFLEVPYDKDNKEK